MTIEEAATRLGEGNYKPLDYTKEEREVLMVAAAPAEHVGATENGRCLSSARATG